MKSRVKGILKECIPPFLMKLLRPEKYNPDPWAHVKFSSANCLELPGGKKFLFRLTIADREVCKQVFFNQDYALKRLKRADDLLLFYTQHVNPIIVDAGANIGAASAWFALAFPKSKILAIEPDVENYQLLTTNGREFSTVIPIQAAIASASGELTLCDPGDGAWAYRTSNNKNESGYPVKAMTIEEILGQAGEGTPFILKIDIEGAEADLFSRHSARFNEFPLVIIELHDWMLPHEANSHNFLRWHTANERDFVFFGENVFSISNSIFQTTNKSLSNSTSLSKN
jgi:FkbM family methyltransferase